MKKREIEIARVIAGISVALGLPLNARACVQQALTMDESQLADLHARLGTLIKVQESLRN
jgi:hypothetical protein